MPRESKSTNIIDLWAHFESFAVTFAIIEIMNERNPDMKKSMKCWYLIKLLMAVSCFGALSQCSSKSSPDIPRPGYPLTIPALREWSTSDTTFQLNASSRIVLDNAYAAQLQTTSSVFADDLLTLTGITVPVITGVAASGDFSTSTSKKPCL